MRGQASMFETTHCMHVRDTRITWRGGVWRDEEERLLLYHGKDKSVSGVKGFGRGERGITRLTKARQVYHLFCC